MVSPDDFGAFFQEVHGCEPFPWQHRLLRRVAAEGQWPDTLDLPTGSGKTAAIDIAVFHLALEASRNDARRAPVRVIFVVDRRLVVDDAFERARRLARALEEPNGPVTERVRHSLKYLAGDGAALIARRLRGGIPREDDWARTPSQPTVLCSTVDQVGSRLLFRGYGVSDSMKPVHAGLIGSDCLILLDEAHLSEPFRQTLGWVRVYQGQRWRDVDCATPWGIASLTATPGEKSRNGFSLDEADALHPVLKKRLGATKAARLIRCTPSRRKGEVSPAIEDNETASNAEDVERRAAALEQEVQRALDHFTDAANGVHAPAIGVVVNRIARARAVHDRLRRKYAEQIRSGAMGEPILMIGPVRPLDREDLVSGLSSIRTRPVSDGQARALEKALVVVATQCVEVGVDIDLDALISEAAPLDALRQRFGRLNRAGRNIAAYAAVVAGGLDLASRYNDPVYGTAIKAAWSYLTETADRAEDGVSVVDFGVTALRARLDATPAPAEALSPKEDAPVLLPAHLDLLSQTSPVPDADPDIALYLRGSDREPDSISLLWRADIEPERPGDDDVRRLLLLVPPRAGEVIELPLWAVRRWLSGAEHVVDGLADIPTRDAEDELPVNPRASGKVFRWRGDDDRSQWVGASDLRPGDTIVVPAIYGGVDEFGWNPRSRTHVKDIARVAAGSLVSRRFAIRIAEGLVGELVSHDALGHALASADSRRWQDLRAALLDLDLPDAIRQDLEALDHARLGRITSYTDLYGFDEHGRPRGVVFVAPLGIAGREVDEGGRPNTTEDDASGSMPGFPLALATHNDDVAHKAEEFAAAAGLSAARVADLRLAAQLHDVGKSDRRFQAWLYHGDPLGPDSEHLLAKSGRPLPRPARGAAGLPKHWRHEALSVRLARTAAAFQQANDPDLVLWLIGTHHGHGRPLFPHYDDAENAPDVGPQCLAFDWHGLDWPSLFARLMARYGLWELARMEAILRLADHRASEKRAVQGDPQ